jgi:starch synthase
MGPEFLKKALLNSSVKEKELESFSDNNNTGMFRGGASYADAITFGAEKVDKKLLDEFSKVRGKKVIPYRADTDLTEYLTLYSDLANK